jgi:DNA ligase-1
MGNAMVIMADHPQLIMVAHVLLKDEEELLDYSTVNLESGYEGTMLRNPHGPYKSGRSTLPQGWLVKYKEWLDAEGSIIGFEERMHNANDDVKDNFGYAKRSSAKQGMEPMGTLGALLLDTEWGELSVGSGLDDALRQNIWNRNMVEHIREDDMGDSWVIRGSQPDLNRVVTFKYQPFGMKDKPRFPIFKHFREEE